MYGEVSVSAFVAHKLVVRPKIKEQEMKLIIDVTRQTRRSKTPIFKIPITLNLISLPHNFHNAS